MPALAAFDEDDLYGAMDEVARRHQRIEKSLYPAYLRRRGRGAPTLVL